MKYWHISSLRRVAVVVWIGHAGFLCIGGVWFHSISTESRASTQILWRMKAAFMINFMWSKSNSNFFKLYDVAMLGFTSHSKLPLRLSAFVGFFSAIVSFLVAVGYFIYKLIYWYEFQIGMAPMVIGIFFFSSVQLFFIGIIGEYIGAIHTQIRKRPLVIEKERVNF